MNLAVCLTVAVVVASIFCGAHNVIGRLFSRDERVVAETARLAWFVGGGYVFLCMFYTSMAVVAGFGRPRIIAIAFLVGAWGVCIPLGYVLSHTVGLGLVGLWSGLVVGYSVVTAIVVTNVLRSDWHEVSKEAMVRSNLKRRSTAGSVDELLLPGDAGGPHMLVEADDSPAEEAPDNVKNPLTDESSSVNDRGARLLSDGHV